MALGIATHAKLTALITGHGCIGAHLWYTHGEVIDPTCQNCEKEAETSAHLYECSDDVYGNSKSRDGIRNATINSVLNYFSNYPIPAMLKERERQHADVLDGDSEQQQ